MRYLIFFALSVTLFGCPFFKSGGFEHSAKLYLEMLDVGQGLSFLIESPNCAVLYDTGTPQSGIDIMLENRKIKALCSVILSHWQNDHAGGLPHLAKMVKDKKLSINRLLISNDYNLNGAAARLKDSVLTLFNEIGIPVYEVYRGDTIGDFAPFNARILLPRANDSSVTENDAGLAFRLSDGETGFLFMGDLGAEQEAVLLSFEPFLEAYALQVGNHGSKTSSSWEFLARVRPQAAFISCGLNNSYGHPNEETLNKLNILLDSSNIFRTDIHGNVKFEWIYGIGMWRE